MLAFQCWDAADKPLDCSPRVTRYGSPPLTFATFNVSLPCALPPPPTAIDGAIKLLSPAPHSQHLTKQPGAVFPSQHNPQYSVERAHTHFFHSEGYKLTMIQPTSLLNHSYTLTLPLFSAVCRSVEAATNTGLRLSSLPLKSLAISAKTKAVFLSSVSTPSSATVKWEEVC